MKNSKLLPLLVLSLLGSLSPVSLAVAQHADHRPGPPSGVESHRLSASISNGVGVLRFRTDPAIGLYFDAVGDAANPQAHRLDRTEVWRVQLRDPNSGTVQEIGPADCSFQFTLETSQGALTAVWRQVSCPALPGGETFEVAVSAAFVDDSPLAHLEVSVNALGTTSSVYRVEFPRVQFRETGSPADQVMTYPYVGGWILPDPMHNPALQLASMATSPFVHPGFLSMQWFTYYDSSKDEAPVLFFGTRDRLGFRKEFFGRIVDRPQGPESFRWELFQIPENNLVSQRYTAPFPAVLGVTRGDWYDAARLYRSWALTQPWTAKGPMVSNPEFSPTIAQANLFAVSGVAQCCPGDPAVDPCACTFDHSNFQYWLRDLEDQKAFFDAGTIPTHIYNWDQNSFDTSNWGEWLPIQDEFLAVAPTVAAAGHPFAPYVLIHQYSTTAPGYTSSYVPEYLGQSVETFALVGEAGNPVQVQQPNSCDRNLGCNIVPTPQTLTITQLDLASDFAYQYAKFLTDQLVVQGARGVYLDVFTNADAQISYNPDLGHPVGGGSYDTQGKIQLVQRLRDHLRNDLGLSDAYVYSESNNEMYLGVLELTYSHATGLTSDDPNSGLPLFRVAPLFETVYHDYHVTATVAGIQAPQDNPVLQDPDQVRILRQFYAAAIFMGRAPWAGSILSPDDMATLMGLYPHYTDFVGMIRAFVDVLKQPSTRDHVVFGQRTRDPFTTSTTVPLPTPGLLPYGTSQPLVYASSWSRPDNGTAGLLLLNWTDDQDSPALGVPTGTQDLDLTIDAATLALPPGTYTLTEVTPTGELELETYDLSTPQTLTVTVPERSARFFYFHP